MKRFFFLIASHLDKRVRSPSCHEGTILIVTHLLNAGCVKEPVEGASLPEDV